MGRNVPSMEINGYAAIFTKPIFKNQKGEWYRDVGYEDSMDLIRENFLGVRKSFVAIGYYLKHLDRKELFRQGGYESIWECAKAEFGLSQTSATRYMQMNEAYSLNGDTPILDERYVEFSKSQLQEMLSLPEEVREEIKPEQTVLEIRQIAREEKKKKEPSESEIRKFYDQWVKEYDTNREGLKESLIEHLGKCHAGAWDDGIKFQCSLRGVRLGEAEEITWAQFVKRVNEYFPAESCDGQDNEHRQIDIYDYPDYLPEAEKMPKEKVVVDGEFREIGEADNVKQDLQSKKNDSIEDAGTKPGEENVATSQKISPYGLSKTEYPPSSLIATEGCGNKYNCFSCAQNCNIRQKERYCVEAPLGNPFSCDTVAVIEKLNEEMGEACQFINQDMAYHRLGDGASVPCCKECVQPGCSYRCLRSADLFQEDAADNHEEQALKYEDDTQEPVTPAEQLSAIRKILEQEQKVLDDYLRVGGLPVMTIFRQKTIVRALAAMVCDLEETDTGCPEEVRKYVTEKIKEIKPAI